MFQIERAGECRIDRLICGSDQNVAARITEAVRRRRLEASCVEVPLHSWTIQSSVADAVRPRSCECCGDVGPGSRHRD